MGRAFILFYFNFIQAEYFKEADSNALSDVKSKLTKRALHWFRWSALATFLTGLLLLVGMKHSNTFNDFTVLAVVLGFLMFANVWGIIWPNQKIVLGLQVGDAALAAQKASLASRTNTLFSAPMAFFMLASAHLGYEADHLLMANGGGLGLWVGLGLVLLLQVNGIIGKMGPMATIRGVIHVSLALYAVLFALVTLV